MARAAAVSEVQDLVDGLAARVQRPVGVDDRRFHAIAYSSHEDEIDTVRRTSILGRQAPVAVTRWLEELGVLQAEGFVRVPANDEFQMVARICFPVRFHGRLLGLLWLMEPDGPLEPEEIAACEQCAADLAEALYRIQQLEDDERRREAAGVRRLLEGTEGDADAAVIAPEAVYAVFVIEVVPPEDQAILSGIDTRLMEIADRLRRSVPPRHQLATTSTADATIIVAAPDQGAFDRYASKLFEVAAEALADTRGARPLVGMSESMVSLEDLPEGLEQARAAVQAARVMSDFGPLVRWDDLGALRLIADLVGSRDPASLMPKSLQRLLADPDGEALALTLETYLEHAGDAAAAAGDLYLHRSSLYNRLRRIQDLAGVDLRSGSDRLELHLGLRLWRMSGARAPSR
jgi:sugar diacid utilization regulator